MSLFLIIAAFLLLAVVAAQDLLVPKLRNETISAGLTGPYHWFLDGSYVVLAAALCTSFAGHGLADFIAVVASVFLLLTAATNTFWKFFDKLTNGKHSLLHSWFTIATFASTFWLEANQNHGWMWGLTAAGVAAPAFVYFLFKKMQPKWGFNPSPAAEKIAVALMCVWLGVWSVLIH